VIARLIEGDPAAEMKALGADPAGIRLMAPKAVFRLIKLTALRPVAANIIKQTMLSNGGDAATAYGSVNLSVKTTDLLVFGTLQQLKSLVAKLKAHQFGLPVIAAEIDRALANYTANPKAIKVGPKKITFGRRTFVMGILNVTPDSFSDGGQFSERVTALCQAEKMIAEGADIIDVGGESTRPGARPVSAAEEIARVIPVIRELGKWRGCAVSIDTRKAAVARAALEAGADMVNDISGLKHDRQMGKVVSRAGVPVCLMHLRGTPKTMQRNPVYSDLMGEVIAELAESLAIANNAGILHEKIILDPGLGFGKTAGHNLEIIARLRELKVLGRPLLVGPSRKSVIGQVLGLPVEARLAGTAALVAAAIMNGADLVRVHDVKELVRVARMTDAIKRR